MQMRKLFAGVAALATLLGGLALGATTANAADPTVDVDSTTKVVTSNATFTFTADSADQWGKANDGTANNRVIKAYKIGDFVQSGDSADNYLYTAATPTTPAGASAALKAALNTALKGKGANGADVTVPEKRILSPGLCRTTGWTPPPTPRMFRRTRITLMPA